MTPDENSIHQAVRRGIINRKNLDAINELVAEDFVECVPFQVRGRDEAG
jgi:hypothetical protein